MDADRYFLLASTAIYESREDTNMVNVGLENQRVLAQQLQEYPLQSIRLVSPLALELSSMLMQLAMALRPTDVLELELLVNANRLPLIYNNYGRAHMIVVYGGDTPVRLRLAELGHGGWLNMRFSSPLISIDIAHLIDKVHTYEHIHLGGVGISGTEILPSLKRLVEAIRNEVSTRRLALELFLKIQLSDSALSDLHEHCRSLSTRGYLFHDNMKMSTITINIGGIAFLPQNVREMRVITSLPGMIIITVQNDPNHITNPEPYDNHSPVRNMRPPFESGG